MIYSKLLALSHSTFQMRRNLTLCKAFHTSFFASFNTIPHTLLHNLSRRFFYTQVQYLPRTHQEFFRKRVSKNFHIPKDFLNEEEIESDLRDDMMKSEDDLFGLFNDPQDLEGMGAILPQDKISPNHFKLRSVSEFERIQKEFGDGLVHDPKPIDFVRLFSLCYYLNDFDTTVKGLKFSRDFNVESPFVYEFLFRLCYKMGEFEHGETLFLQTPERMVSSSALATIALILGERGNVASIKRLLAKQEPTPYLVSALILGYLRSNRKDLAVETLDQYDLKSTLPYNVLLSEFSKMGETDLIALVLEKMDEMEVQPDVITISVLILSNLKNENYDGVMSIIETLDPNQFSNNEFNTILSTLIEHPDIMEKAVDIFSMKGTTLNFEGYLSLIKSMCSIGEIEACFDTLEEMINHNLQLFPEVFKILVRACMYAHNLKRALDACEMCGRVLGVYEKGRLLHSLLEFAKSNLPVNNVQLIKKKMKNEFNLREPLPPLSPSAHLLYERASDKIKDLIIQQKDEEFLQVTEIVTRIMEPIKFQLSKELFDEYHPKYPAYYEIFTGAIFKIISIGVMQNATRDFFANSITQGLPIDEFLVSNVLDVMQQTNLKVLKALMRMLTVYDTVIKKFNIIPTSHTITPILKAFLTVRKYDGLVAFFDSEIPKYQINATTTMYILYYHSKLCITKSYELEDTINEMRERMSGNDYAKKCLYQVLARFTYKRKDIMKTIFSHIVQFLIEDNIPPFENTYHLLIHFYYATQNYEKLQKLFDMGKAWIQNGLAEGTKLFTPKLYLKILRSYEEQNDLSTFLKSFHEIDHYKLTYQPSHLDVYCKFFLKLGRLDEVVDFLRSINTDVCRISAITYSRVIRAFGEKNDLLNAEMYFEERKKSEGKKPDNLVYIDKLHAALLDAYAMTDIEKAIRFFMNTNEKTMGADTLHALLDNLFFWITKSEDVFQRVVSVWPQVIEKAEQRGNVLFFGERATLGATFAKHISRIASNKNPQEIELFLERFEYLKTLDDEYWKLSMSATELCSDVNVGLDSLRNLLNEMKNSENESNESNQIIMQNVVK